VAFVNKQVECVVYVVIIANCLLYYLLQILVSFMGHKSDRKSLNVRCFSVKRDASVEIETFCSAGIQYMSGFIILS